MTSFVCLPLDRIKWINNNDNKILIEKLKQRFKKYHHNLNPYHNDSILISIICFTDKYTLALNSHKSNGCFRIKYDCIEKEEDANKLENMPMLSVYNDKTDHRGLAKIVFMTIGDYIKKPFYIFNPLTKKLQKYQIIIVGWAADSPERWSWCDCKKNMCENCDYTDMKNTLKNKYGNINDAICKYNKNDYHKLFQ